MKSVKKEAIGTSGGGQGGAFGGQLSALRSQPSVSPFFAAQYNCPFLLSILRYEVES